jgi:RNA polymerase-interacting CarD/CdnL/TRCF family regulator
MPYKVGETVVYPHHGAADIIKKEKLTIKGVEREYLALRVHQSELTVKVPSENVELVGVVVVSPRKRGDVPVLTTHVHDQGLGLTGTQHYHRHGGTKGCFER